MQSAQANAKFKPKWSDLFILCLWWAYLNKCLLIRKFSRITVFYSISLACPKWYFRLTSYFFPKFIPIFIFAIEIRISPTKQQNTYLNTLIFVLSAPNLFFTSLKMFILDNPRKKKNTKKECVSLRILPINSPLPKSYKVPMFY